MRMTFFFMVSTVLSTTGTRTTTTTLRRNSLVSTTFTNPFTTAFVSSSPIIKPTTTTTTTISVARVKPTPLSSWNTNLKNHPPVTSQIRLFAASSSSKSGPKSYPKHKKNRNLVRADRVLSNRGWSSRSECFRVLKQNRVSMYSEKEGTWVPVLGPSTKIPMDCQIRVDGTHTVETIPLLYVYHKPKWILSVMHDPRGRPTLADIGLSTTLTKQLHPVGRLDYDTSGLLLFSSDGKLTQKLLHPTQGIEKEYVALVEGHVDTTLLQEQLEVTGVKTTEGTHTAKLVHVDHMDSPQEVSSILQNVRDTLPQEYNTTDLEQKGYLHPNCTSISQVRLVVNEGKHRMVRRVLANCGHAVIELRRERHGVIQLGDLKQGEFRHLQPHELEWALQLSKNRKKIKALSKEKKDVN